jgi:hypothetical protein
MPHVGGQRFGHTGDLEPREQLPGLQERDAEHRAVRALIKHCTSAMTPRDRVRPPVETVYAMTIHKSQGSQFETAAVVLPDATSPILTRGLLYTAVTRAQRHLIVAGTEEAVRAAVARPIARASGLGERLWGGARQPRESPCSGSAAGAHERGVASPRGYDALRATRRALRASASQAAAARLPRESRRCLRTVEQCAIEERRIDVGAKALQGVRDELVAWPGLWRGELVETAELSVRRGCALGGE